MKGNVRFKLREIRKARGLTLTQLSEKAGVAYNSVGAIDRNQAVRVDVRTVEKLCFILDCEPGDLIVREE